MVDAASKSKIVEEDDLDDTDEVGHQFHPHQLIDINVLVLFDQHHFPYFRDQRVKIC